MKSGFLGALAFMLVGAAWATAQGPAAAPAHLSPSSAALVPNNYPVYPTIGDSGMASPTPANGPSYIPADAIGAGHGGAVFYADADYLLYKFRNSTIPTAASAVPVGLISVNTTNLLTTTPGGPITSATPTVVGFAPVSIISNATFGSGPQTNFGSQNGARLNLGFWDDADKSWGMEAVGTIVERGIDHIAAVAGASPNQFTINTGFTRSLFLVNPGPPVTQTLVSTFPVLVVRQSQTSLLGNASNDLYGGELNFRCVGVRLGCVDFGGLLGFRYLLYKDEIGLLSNTSLVHPAGFPITDGDASASLSQNLSFSTLDRVRVWNHFFGGQTGIDIDAKFGSFFVNVRGKLALGDMHQVADIEGVTSVVNNDPVHITPPSSTNAGGLLSSPADIGSHNRDRFTYIPELNLKIGYQFTSWFRAYAGYDAMVIGHAALAGDSSVTNTLNTNITIAGSAQNVNVAQPAFRFQDRDVWVQGLTFGMEFQF